MQEKTEKKKAPTFSGQPLAGTTESKVEKSVVKEKNVTQAAAPVEPVIAQPKVGLDGGIKIPTFLKRDNRK